MKIVISAGFLFFPLAFVQAQNFNIAVFNKTFVDCNLTYDELVRLPIYKNGYTEKFFKDGIAYSGLAKTIFKEHTGEILEYVISEMKDAYPTTSLYYFPDGTMSRTFNFTDGLSDGRQMHYFDDGKKYIEENYQRGKKHGLVRRWTREGDIARDAFYQNGIPIFDKVYIKDDRC